MLIIQKGGKEYITKEWLKWSRGAASRKVMRGQWKEWGKGTIFFCYKASRII